MPKKDYVHLCIVLDASGSMNCIADDIKGSFNAFMDEQKNQEGQTVFDVFQFSSQVRRIVKHADMSEYSGDLVSSYCCQGNTALFDAVCTAIDTVGSELAAMPEEERPEHVIFAIATDGHENASREYTLADTKERIDRQSNKYAWEFIYLAADQSEFEARHISRSMGIAGSSTVDKACFCRMAVTTLKESVTNARKGCSKKKN
ncbi:MAG: VWA domain-containing protein [Lentisphaerae bacterium]|nr:VWA domain-containing protein [Lentisphaerota bacterium]